MLVDRRPGLPCDDHLCAGADHHDAPRHDISHNAASHHVTSDDDT